MSVGGTERMKGEGADLNKNVAIEELFQGVISVSVGSCLYVIQKDAKHVVILFHPLKSH